MCAKGFEAAPNDQSESAENSTCIDINECELGTHDCEFSCENTVGSYECICDNGFRQDSAKRLCIPVGKAPRLLVSQSGKFLVSELDFERRNLSFTIFPNSCEEPASTVFAYDQNEDAIYFVHSNRSAILRVRVNESCSETITDRTNISALEVDWINGKLYWADSKGLNVAKSTGQHPTVLFESRLPVHNLVVDPFSGGLLFTTRQKVWLVGRDGAAEMAISPSKSFLAVVHEAKRKLIVIQDNSSIYACSGPFECESVTKDSQDLTLIDVFSSFVFVANMSRPHHLTVLGEHSSLEFGLQGELTKWHAATGRILRELNQPSGESTSEELCSDLCLKIPTVSGPLCVCYRNVGTTCTTESTPTSFMNIELSGSSMVCMVAIAAVTMLTATLFFYTVIRRCCGPQQDVRGRVDAVPSLDLCENEECMDCRVSDGIYEIPVFLKRSEYDNVSASEQIDDECRYF